MKNRNLTLMTDLYELTMMQGYFNEDTREVVVFDMFYRKNPCGSGYAIAAGLEQLIDYIRTTVVHAGGITHLRRIADLASLYQVRTGCHGATDLSPVCMGAALHFDLWVPNFGIQEYMRHTEETDAVFPHAYTFSQGMLYPGDVPGHGVDIDEKLAAKYPYKRAYLPVNRLQQDGTLWNW